MIDVDEYITFNTVHEEDDPGLPLDWAPEGVPTLSDWTKKVYNLVDPESGELVIDGKLFMSRLLCYIALTIPNANLYGSPHVR